MNSNECPNCHSEKWKFVSGWQNNEPIEPDEGWCEDCGFQYKEHCKDPLQNQIERFRKEPTP